VRYLAPAGDVAGDVAADAVRDVVSSRCPPSRRGPLMSDTHDSGLPRALGRVLDRMCCPRCRGALQPDGDGLLCATCDLRFPARGEIPLLAIHGTAETWTQPTESETSAAYQQAYEELEEARRYNDEYRQYATKRWSTKKEYKILDKLLRTQQRSEVLLDLPCGGGRLSKQLAEHADFLVEADIGLGQLLVAREDYAGRDDRVWMTASAFHIPFQDASVDAVVCCRLCHHLPTAEERERLLMELLRVARRFVVMTFFDYYSIKNYNRRMRAPFDRKPSKLTMTIERVSELARQHGAELMAWPALSHLFSGHRYALIVKR
jgi:ubiquinone/menaquinone biosynthesis C-methylase UbiE/uncharacterized protein YbaR (Trm112 family)